MPAEQHKRGMQSAFAAIFEQETAAMTPGGLASDGQSQTGATGVAAA